MTIPSVSTSKHWMHFPVIAHFSPAWQQPLGSTVCAAGWVWGVLELSLNQTCLPAAGDSLSQDRAGKNTGGFLCCLTWPLPGLGLAGLGMQAGMSGRLQNLWEQTW